MTMPGKFGLFLVLALSATGSMAFAVAPNSSCRAGVTTGAQPSSGATPQNPCVEPGITAHQTQGVVRAADLRVQVSDQKLSSQEVQALAQNAKTRSEHMRLAGYYGVRADSDMAQAQHQQQMAMNYSASPVGSSAKFASGTVDHCVAIVRRLRQHAAKMRKLQKEQEQLAGEAGE